MPKELQWEPTQDGQAVLYGVPGPSYDKGKFAKGYTVLFDERRNEIAEVYDANCEVREQRVDQNNAWPVRHFPQGARGTSDAENGEIVLKHSGKEIARGVVENHRAQLPERLQDFNPAAMLAGEAA